MSRQWRKRLLWSHLACLTVRYPTTYACAYVYTRPWVYRDMSCTSAHEVYRQMTSFCFTAGGVGASIWGADWRLDRWRADAGSILESLVWCGQSGTLDNCDDMHVSCEPFGICSHGLPMTAYACTQQMGSRIDGRQMMGASSRVSFGAPQVFMHLYAHTCVCVYVCTYVCAYMMMGACSSVSFGAPQVYYVCVIYIYTYMYMYIHIYIHK